MDKQQLRRLAGDLKHFLQACDEDDFIPTAAPANQAAAAEISRAAQTLSPAAPAMRENSTLTIDFPRAQEETAPTSQPTTSQGTIMTTAQKQAALQELAETIKQCSRCALA